MKFLMDHHGICMDIYIGCIHREYAARMFQKSGLFQYGEAGVLFPRNTTVTNGMSMPTVIVGNPECPLLLWLVKPYPDVHH